MLASPRANSTSPRLSDTLSSARWIRTSPGATVSAAGGPVSAIGLPAHQRRFVRIQRHAPRRDQPHGAWQQPVLDLLEVPPGRRDVAMVRKLERLLQQNRPAVDALVDEMDRDAGHLHAVVERLLDDPQPGERR